MLQSRMWPGTVASGQQSLAAGREEQQEQSSICPTMLREQSCHIS